MSTGRMLLKELYVGFLLLLLTFLYLSHLNREAVAETSRAGLPLREQTIKAKRTELPAGGTTVRG